MTRVLYISYNAMTEPIVQSQVIPYLRELSKGGIKFYLITFEKKKITKHEKDMIKGRLKKEFSGSLSLEWFSLRYHKRPSVPATIFDIIAGFLRSIYIITRNKVDIVHARAIVAALIGYPAAKLLSKKFIFDTRGVDSEEYVDAGLWKRGGAKHRLAGYFENMLAKNSDHVIILTERFLEILRDRHRGRGINFSVIPCAVDTERFKPVRGRGSGLPDALTSRDKFVIVYAGSLGTWYMLPEMIDFFKIATGHISNTHFLILTQTDKKYALDLIKKKNLNADCVTVREAAPELMPYYLSACNAGLFFIKPVFSKLSSSPVKFGEYLASGLPVVINSKIGNTEKIVRENRVGVIVEDFGEPGYKKAVRDLLCLMEDAALGKRCRITAEKYLSLDAAVRKYADIYQNMAGKK